MENTRTIVTHTNVQVRKSTNEFVIDKVNQVVWFIIAVIVTIIAVRFFLLLLGANNVGIVNSFYDISRGLILPFVGIFESVASKNPADPFKFFEVASIIAIIFYLIVGLIVTYLISIFSKRTS